MIEEEKNVKHVQKVTKNLPLPALNDGQLDFSQLMTCWQDSHKKQRMQCIGIFIYGSDGKNCCS